MATEQRTIRLNIEGSNSGLRPFNEVRNSIKGIGDSMSQMVRDAARGEASVHDLERGLKSLGGSNTELLKLARAMDDIGRAAARVEEAEKKAAEAAERFRTAQAAVAGAGTPNARQTRSLESASNAQSAAQGRLDAARSGLAGRESAARALGLDPADFKGVETALQEQARIVGLTTAQLRTAIENYNKTLRSYREEQQKTAAEAKALNDAMQQAADREVARLAALAAARKAAADSAARDSQKQQDELTRFRDSAARYAEPLRPSTLTSSRVNGSVGDTTASSVRAILDPAQAARSTLQGLTDEVARLNAATTGIKGPIKDYSDTLMTLAGAQREVARQAGVVDAVIRQNASFNQARTAYRESRAELAAVTSQMQAATVPSDALTRKARELSAEVLRARDALSQETIKLREVRSAAQDAGVGLQNLRGAQTELIASSAQLNVAQTRLQAGLRAYGAANPAGSGIFGFSPYALQNMSYQVNDLFTQVASGTSVMQAFAQQGGQIFQIFQQTEGGLATLVRILPVAAVGLAALGTAYAAVSRSLETARSTREFSAALQLNADGATYNAQRLTELARAAERTGADFQEARTALASFVGRGADPASLGGLLETARNVSRALGIDLKDAAKQMADGLFSSFEAVTRLNGAWNFLSEAQNKAIREAFESGDAQRAQGMAFEALQGRVQGVSATLQTTWSQASREAKNAWNDFLDALSKSAVFSAVGALVNGLAGQVRGLIRELGSAQSVADAQAQVRSLESPFTLGAVISAVSGQGYQRTLALQAARDNLARLQRGAVTVPEPGAVVAGAATGGASPGVSNRDEVARDNYIRNLEREAAARARRSASRRQQEDAVRAEERQRLGETGGSAVQDGDVERATAARMAERRAEWRESDARHATEMRQLRERRGANIQAIAAAEARARVDSQAAGENEDATNRRILDYARDAGARTRSGGGAARALENQEVSLANRISQLRAQVARGDASNVEARVQGIRERFEPLFRTIEQFQRRGGRDVEGTPLADIRAQAEAQMTTLMNQERLKANEDRLTAAVRERSELLKGIGERLSSGELSGADAAREVEEITRRTSGNIRSMAREAAVFARTLPSTPSTQSYIARMDRESGETSATGRRDYAALVAAAEQRVNSLLQERNNIVSANNQLAQANVISIGTAAERNRQAYERANEPIRAAVTDMEALGRAAQTTGGLTQQQFDLMTAKAAQFRSQVAYVSPEMTAIKTGLEQGVVSGASTMFDTLGKSMAEFYQGTKSMKDVFKDVGRAALQMGADILKAVAQAIIKMLILRAVSAAMGDWSGAGAGVANAATNVRHGGGMVGRYGNRTREVSPFLFYGAARYHTGGMVGLAPNEQTAILEVGEEVLAANDPRNARNGGGSEVPSGPSEIGIRNVIVMDPDMITDAMQSPGGERVVMNYIKNNAPTVRKLIGM